MRYRKPVWLVSAAGGSAVEHETLQNSLGLCLLLVCVLQSTRYCKTVRLVSTALVCAVEHETLQNSPGLCSLLVCVLQSTRYCKTVWLVATAGVCAVEHEISQDSPACVSCWCVSCGVWKRYAEGAIKTAAAAADMAIQAWCCEA